MSDTSYPREPGRLWRTPPTRNGPGKRAFAVSFLCSITKEGGRDVRTARR